MAFNLTNRFHQIIDQITVAQEQHDNADNQGNQQHILVDGKVLLRQENGIVRLNSDHVFIRHTAEFHTQRRVLFAKQLAEIVHPAVFNRRQHWSHCVL